MKNLLKAEQLAQLVICIFLIYSLPIHLSWWVYLLLFVAPDLSMFGYAINTHAGGCIYNIVHHKLSASLVVIFGYLLNEPQILLVGLSMWGHSAMDRMFGYGLKYNDSFQHTHLGWLTKKNN